MHDQEYKVIYTALFIDDLDKFIETFPPKHKNIFADHSTTCFWREGLLDISSVGEKSVLKVTGRVWDDKGDAILVENPKSKNKHPHITISCVDGVQPVYSKELIEKALGDGTAAYFETPYLIEVTEGYFDSAGNYVLSK